MVTHTHHPWANKLPSHACVSFCIQKIQLTQSSIPRCFNYRITLLLICQGLFCLVCYNTVFNYEIAIVTHFRLKWKHSFESNHLFGLVCFLCGLWFFLLLPKCHLWKIFCWHIQDYAVLACSRIRGLLLNRKNQFPDLIFNIKFIIFAKVVRESH